MLSGFVEHLFCRESGLPRKSFCQEAIELAPALAPGLALALEVTPHRFEGGAGCRENFQWSVQYACANTIASSDGY